MAEKYVEIPVKHMKRFVSNYTPTMAKQTFLIDNPVAIKDLPDSMKRLKLSEFVEICLQLSKVPIISFE